MFPTWELKFQLIFIYENFGGFIYENYAAFNKVKLEEVIP